jgi:hypothetical protein
MARTRAWDESKPTGALQVRQMDNENRDTKIDIREIFNQLMGVPEATPLADPVIAPLSTHATFRSELDTLNSQFTNLQRQFALPYFVAGHIVTTGSPALNATYVTVPAAAGNSWNGYMHVNLPTGTILNTISIFGRCVNISVQSSVINIAIYNTTNMGVVYSGSVTMPANPTDTVIESTAINRTILSTDMVVLNPVISSTGAAGDAPRFYYALVKYTSPNVGTRY